MLPRCTEPQHKKKLKLLRHVLVFHWGDPGVDGRIILGWIFRKWDVAVWTGLGWLRIGTGGGQ
jgi:hypothetical protein